MTGSDCSRQVQQDAEVGQRPTVASLGLRIRLVPEGDARDAALTDIIVAYERLCAQWEALVHQSLAVVGEDIRVRGVPSPTHPSRRSLTNASGAPCRLLKR